MNSTEENKKNLIIGMVGFIGSGKDTAADYLVNNYKFHRYSFAGTLKDAISAVFGWDRNLLEGLTSEARDWRESVDIWWANRLKIPHLTPRWVLQHWGTDILRNYFHNEIWVSSLENKLRKTDDNIVISDVRFPNEINAIHNAGGLVVRIKKGPEPEWYKDALNYNAGPKQIGWAIGRSNLEKFNVHPSESSWIGEDIDCVIENDGTLDDLYLQLRYLVEDRP
jgi:hypothetical protein